MSVKQKIVIQCFQQLEAKINSLKDILDGLSDSATNNTKSSAGDKHETARAMIQIEQEAISKQLTEALEQKTAFGKIDTTIDSSQIIKGSLVKTNKGYLFLSIAFGKITIDDISVMAISPQSPLGLKLIGLKVNDSTEINGMSYFIESII